MNGASRYKNQHKIILSMCSALEVAAQPEAIKDDFDYLWSVLKTLDDILTTHLKAEDDFLYPRLINGEDKPLSEVAKKIQDEMGTVSIAYGMYKEKFSSKESILENIESFYKETKLIVAALDERIAKEEKELFSMIR